MEKQRNKKQKQKKNENSNKKLKRNNSKIIMYIILLMIFVYLGYTIYLLLREPTAIFTVENGQLYEEETEIRICYKK